MGVGSALCRILYNGLLDHVSGLTIPRWPFVWVACNGFDPVDQMRRYCDWWRKGYLSSTGVCFDIGNTAANALAKFEAAGEPYSGSTDPFSAGPGSLMQLAPAALYYHPDLHNMIKFTAKSSMTTHGVRESVEACQYFANLPYLVLAGVSKDELLSGASFEPSSKKLRAICTGGFLGKEAKMIRGSEYVVESLEAALWCFYHQGSYESAVLAAANLGDDADTTAAICGQIAGAFYGEEGLPGKWRGKLAMADFIEEMADKLFAREPVEATSIETAP